MKITYYDCPYSDYSTLEIDPVYGCLHADGTGICTGIDCDEGIDCELLDNMLLIYEEKWL